MSSEEKSESPGLSADIEEEKETEVEEEEENRVDPDPEEIDEETSEEESNEEMAQAQVFVSRTLRTQPFIPTTEETAEAWTDWLEGLERELRFLKIENAEDKKDAMLIYGGKEIVRLEKTLPDAAAEDPPLDAYGKLRKKLNGYFIAKKNKHHSRYIFNKLKQAEGESIISYATRLREKAKECEFENQDDRILEHLIQTVDNRILLRKAISKKMNLDRFLEEAAQSEEIEKQINTMKSEETPTTSIAKVGKKKLYPKKERHSDGKKEEKKNACPYCNLTGKHPPGRNCPAYGQKCRRCERMNHFEAACRANIDKPKWKEKRKEDKKKKVRSTKEDDRTEEDTEEDTEDETSSDESYVRIVLKVKNKQEKTVKVQINDVEMKMEPDSGAEVNLMDEHQFKSLKKKMSYEAKLQKSKVKLKTIQGELTTKGEFLARIGNTNKQIEAKIIVITGHMDSAPLLGRETLIQLGMLKIDPEGRLEENPVIKKVGKSYETIVKKYDVFEGIGLIRDKRRNEDIYATFNMKEDAVPVAQKARPVAYYLQEPLKKWLDQCVEEGIYERVPADEPITWCSPLVVQPKPRYKKRRKPETTDDKSIHRLESAEQIHGKKPNSTESHCGRLQPQIP